MPSWGTTFTVEAATLKAATTIGLAALIAAAQQAGQTDVAPVQLEVITEAEADRRLAEPPVPELLSTGDIADELGVSRQRVLQIIREQPGVFVPAARTKGGDLYLRAAVVRYQERRRGPGRPSKSRSDG